MFAMVEVIKAPSNDLFNDFTLSNYKLIYIICLVDMEPDEPLSIFFNNLFNDSLLFSF